MNKESTGMLNQLNSNVSLKHSPSPNKTQILRNSNSKLSSKKRFADEQIKTSMSKKEDVSKKSSKKKSVGGGLDKESRD